MQQKLNESSAKAEEFIIKQLYGKYGSDISSYELAVDTSHLIRDLVENKDWETAEELIANIRLAHKRIQQDLPHHWVALNTIKRILKMIRDDYRSASYAEHQHGDIPERLQMLETRTDGKVDYKKKIPDLRERIEEILDELLFEFESSASEISKKAIEHIHANEIILTLGRSNSVEKFLNHAANKGRKFQVIVAENAPSYSGHKLAANLAASKINTTVITDSSIFSIMARVNKVIIGTGSILADGGLNAASGTLTMALAAAHYSVPLIVLGAVYKLTPKFISRSDQQCSSILASPEAVLGDLEAETGGKVGCLNPVYEYVPPHLVTLFISNLSGYTPSYVYRQINDLYHDEDKDLDTA